LKKNEEDVQVIKQKMTNVKAQMSNQAQNLNDKILAFWHWDLNWNLDFEIWISKPGLFSGKYIGYDHDGKK
jgi:hypothetical protein